MALLVLINGLPASGKSTLTARLSIDLNLPAFAKDDFKELIADTIGYTDHESTTQFGRASFVALFLVARRCLEKNVSVIIEGNFTLGAETKEFLSYLDKAGVGVREVLCHADPALLAKRFKDRTQNPSRHPVHHTLGEEELNAWIDRALSGDGKTPTLTTQKVLEVDTTDLTEQSYKEVLEFLRS